MREREREKYTERWWGIVANTFDFTPSSGLVSTRPRVKSIQIRTLHPSGKTKYCPGLESFDRRFDCTLHC